MMVSKLQRTDDDIRSVTNAWCDNPAKAMAKYGHISKWNTSMVTNTSRLFYDKKHFNDVIIKWNVSKVTDMSSMFYQAPFNGDISGQNVSSVSNMSSIFMRIEMG